MSELARPFTRSPHRLTFESSVRLALEEDLGRAGDLTTDLLIDPDKHAEARLVARAPGTLSGLICAATAFRLIDPDVEIACGALDGEPVIPDTSIATIRGRARALLSAERVALNFVGHLSGIATRTRGLVDAVAGTKTRVVCTRKTTPGLRTLEKYAVRCGGGFNHRFGLDDAVLIKDNHIAAAGGLRLAIERARAGLGHMTKLEVEVDTLAQLEQALSLGVGVILLDNMNIVELKESVRLAGGRAVLEASGGITLESAREIALTGVDYISSGAITHSASALDVGLDF
ncbi:MAG TPA: carboxylating nicotinate-nucleotide diphosphorylase [Rhizomicrobium sp.]|jgi:nicotinate-nucleotide pyrophosphorylase (carboxylating)|nr:carboxylating nicotinate-nucleotide diphosphorylase [Rhizomicrobium sp.]